MDFRLWGNIVAGEKVYLFLPGFEIAEQLGIKPGSMWMRYTRAKCKVAKALLAKGFSPEDLF